MYKHSKQLSVENLLKTTVNAAEAILYTKQEPLSLDTNGNFVVSGIGISEAHARYAAHLINTFTPATAYFRAVSEFYTHPLKAPLGETLLLFCDQFCANALIPLHQTKQLNGSIIFTGQTYASFRSRLEIASPDLTDKINHLISYGQSDDEGILIKLVRSLTGYFAGIQFVNRQWPLKLPVLPKKFLQSLQPIDALPENLSDYKNGGLLLADDEILRFGQSLIRKFTDCLLHPPFYMTDPMSFCHGPLQQFVLNPAPVIIFKNNQKPQEILVKKAQSILKSTGIKPWIVSSQRRTPYTIIDYEMAMNQLVLACLNKWKWDHSAHIRKRLGDTILSITHP